MLAVGVDLIRVDRIAETTERFGSRFLERVFTQRERVYCGDDSRSLAGRWAAKEATAKALGTGIGDVAWREIEVLPDENGAPRLQLSGAALALAQQRGIQEWAVSISHTGEHAIAFVVMT